MSDYYNNRVVELPAGATSAGEQVTLPFGGLVRPVGVALDQAGDVVVGDSNNGRVVALPAGATSSDQQVTLPFTGLGLVNGVAVSGRGDVAAASYTNNDVLELPRFVAPPVITARATSSVPRSAAGWYRSPVTVSFTCRARHFPLTGPCPPPTLLSHNGAGQRVSGQISASIGGTATASAGPINIDQTPPRVRVAGVRDGHIYRASVPSPRCDATDRLSGVATCHLTRKVRRTPTGTVVRCRAVAVDKAGNRAVATSRYRTLRIYLRRVPFSADAFDVRAGRSYRLVTTSTIRRPVYYDATVVPRRPYQRGSAFDHADPRRWTKRIHLEPAMADHEYWWLGVKIGRRIHLVRIRVS